MARKNTIPTLETPVSPYKLAEFITENTDLEVAPQRMYQYARSGKLVTSLNELGHKVVSVEDGNAFIAWFLDPERKTRKAAEEAEVEKEESATS